MKKIFFFFFLVVLHTVLSAQIRISGNVVEVYSQEPVVMATIYFERANIITVTDAAGKFTAEIPVLEPVRISHVGYETFIKTIEDRMVNAYDLNIYLTPANTIFNPVVITSARADFKTPLTYTNIKGEDLNKYQAGEDMPMLLAFTPSAVVTSDAGNGVGYTGIRIRGSDATRINVTINGVPYNDAESQQTYWVDVPDFAASVDDLQIQRGVGSSTNGMSAFGGAINIHTNTLEEKPYGNISAAAGSFHLFRTSVSFGTGRIHNRWFLEGRASKITSDGFIDRSFSDLSSFFITGAYKSDHYASIVNVFSGKEKTYQSWGGVPKDSLETNRTFNPYTYENQTDNYTQTHVQWHHHFYMKKKEQITLTFNYTPGKGYYEQWEEDQYFSDYGVDDVIIGADTVYASDIITQKWLNSRFYGAYIQYQNELSDAVDLTAGAAFYQHDGDHFGKVVWSAYAAPFGYNYEWYRNDATKKDGNIFVQTNFDITDKLLLYTDLQLRNVHYNFLGLDAEANNVEQAVNLLFFNPKLGVSYSFNTRNLLYASVARAGKEPNRDDYTESSPLSRPAPEILYDTELGSKLLCKGWQLQTTLYYMHYINQLILTGAINDVGAYTRTNVPKSYRTGIEIVWAKTFFEKLEWEANFSFSKNIIHSYTEFVDNWDTGEQENFSYSNSVMAFSPSVVAANTVEYQLFSNENPEGQKSSVLSIALQSKYVGKQYIDNTTNAERSLDPYFLTNGILAWTLSTTAFSEINLSFRVQNVFDHMYESNAWVYRYVYEGTEDELNGYFPQAGRSYAGVMSFRF
ncbi:MAG: carboxypeptidase-like regulatory domain-containing protein [Chitinophagales bacterium]|nr:carboxypeptidase-like regulatory domain-containing protein [Chitinophagales bacterium]